MSIVHRCALTGAAGLALAATHASATWSILIADMRTGEIVIASATCVPSIDLRRETPVLITGVGAVTAQSAVDTSGRNRMLIRDRLLQGVPLESILDELADTDSGHGNRQYGFITADGHTLTYSGFQNADWAGGITGRIERGELGLADDIVYSVQGNILSGPNVVQDAVNAIINTDSDLPGRLMAGMQAGKFGGGDGRCSCSAADPTGCGSPPPGPFKSAHVGYMLGARLDDIDSVRGSYPLPDLVGGMTLADLDHNGFEDVIVGSSTTGEITVFINAANLGDPLSHVLQTQSLMLDATQTVEMSTGDFNNDGFDDVAAVLASPPTLAVMLGQESGLLAEPITLALPGVPSGLDAGDLMAADGDEMAVSIAESDSVKTFGLSNGSLGELGTLTLSGATGEVRIGQFGGDGLLDLAIAMPNDNQVWIGENIGGGGFNTVATLPTATNPIKVVAADITDSGTQDLVVLSQEGRRAEVFADTGGGWSLRNSIAINRDGRGIAAGDFNDDGLVDIITTSSLTQRNLQLFVNDGQGGFTFQERIRVGSGSRFVELADMNNNGNLDIVIGQGGNDGLMLIDNPRGAPMSQPGRFADGEYFLELNIANQRQDDPDPVDQLQTQFDAWRATLTGKVDAVHSKVVGRSRIALGSQSSIAVELRDWQGELLPISDPGSWSIAGREDLFSIGTPTMVEPGIFSFTLGAGDVAGHDSIIIRVGDGDDRVRLMPDLSVFAVENVADFTADGVLDFFDVSAFLHALYTQSPDADLNGDGVFSSLDLSAFLAAFNG